MFGKRKILLFSLLLSLILHTLFLAILFLFIKSDENKEDTYKKKEIYIYLPKKEIKSSENTRNKLKIPKSEKKGNKIISSRPNSDSPTKKKIRNLTPPKKVKKLSKQKSSIPKKPYQKENQRDKKKIEKDKEIKEKTEVKQVKTDNKEKDIKLTADFIEERDEKKKKPLSIRELAGKEEVFELGKKSVSDEELKRDEDVEGYIRALTMYLNQLSRRKDLYPPMAKRLKLEGSLIVRFKINRDGTVDEKSIRIIISSGYNVLDEGAVRIIKKYVPKFAEKYKKYPPRDNFIVELPITFEIIGW